MPITPSFATQRLSQAEFKLVAHEVMGHVFAIHRDFGRLFDEQIYKKELASRMPGIELEVAIGISHGSFSKTYFADVIAACGGLFEFKAADNIHPRHRGQAIHYLLLLDLAHGKVVNVRPEQVQHEFVNCHRRLSDLRSPRIDVSEWDDRLPGAERFRGLLTELCFAWGTGLELSLYEEAMTHLLGGERVVHVPVPVFGISGHLAYQRMRMAAPEIAFRLTSLPDRLDSFAIHAAGFLRHTPLEAILWANITPQSIRFAAIR